MNPLQKLLGIPFVYNRIRPFVVGGIDMTPLYRILEATENDTILDIGCGTGIAMDYLSSFQSYFGFDTDPVAIAHARKRYGDRPKVHYECRLFTADDFKIRPTRVIMSGLLHHLPDADAVSLLNICSQSRTVKRIATQDVIYLPGKILNNLLAWMDRGRHVRDLEGYHRLIQNTGWKIVTKEIVRSHPIHGHVYYFLMGLEARN